MALDMWEVAKAWITSDALQTSNDLNDLVHLVRCDTHLSKLSVFSFFAKKATVFNSREELHFGHVDYFIGHCG